MEPRPQKPRPQSPAAGAPTSQPTGHVAPDATQQTQQVPYPPGYDPAAFIAPPRVEYDYSPLDLQPPGQRRKRQIIAGIIGALVVVAIAALIVAGWMALRDDNDVDNTSNNDRVAELTASPTSSASDSTNTNTPAADTTTATTVPPTAVPTAPPATTYTASTIRSALPVVESMPGAFVEAGDTPYTLEDVTENLGGGPAIETMLADLGWQASMQRNYDSADPATTGTTGITVSVHAFKDEPSTQTALTEYAAILESFGWTPVEWEQYGAGSRMFVWTNPTTGDESVSIYVVEGTLLYRVMATGPAGFDSTENAIWVVNQILQN